MDKVSMGKSAYLEPSGRDIDLGLYIQGAGMNLQRQQEGFPDNNEGRILNDYAFVYLTEGSGKYYFDAENSTQVRGGDLIVLFPGLWHHYYVTPGDYWDEYWVIMNGSYMRELENKGFFSRNRRIIKPGIDNLLKNYFTELVEQTCALRGRQLPLASKLMQIICRIQELTEFSVGESLPSPVKKAVEIIEDSYNKDIDFEKTALSLGMSYAHFRRIFKKHTGMSPHQYQLSLRINRAKTFLSGGGYNIKEAANMTGFSDQYYFSRLFRKKTGTAPSEWKGL